MNGMFSDVELKILKTHKYIPENYIYHVATAESYQSIIKSNALKPRWQYMYSLTANPHLRTILPFGTRKYRLILNFPEVKKLFDIFPVYYYTAREFLREEPPEWLIEYYMEKTGADYEDLSTWNSAPELYKFRGPPFWRESEWKGIKPIRPLDKYLVSVQRLI